MIRILESEADPTKSAEMINGGWQDPEERMEGEDSNENLIKQSNKKAPPREIAATILIQRTNRGGVLVAVDQEGLVPRGRVTRTKDTLRIKVQERETCGKQH